MCPGTDMNEIFDTLLGDDSDADIYWGGYEKKIYNETSDCDNENLHIPNVSTLSEESAINMIADKDVDHVPKNFSPCDGSHICAHGAAARTYSCS